MQEKTRQNLAKIVIIFLGFLIPSFIFFGVLKGRIYSASSDTINLQGKIVRNDAGYEGLNISTGSPACVVSGDGNDTCDFRIRYYDAPTAGNLLLTEQFSNVEIGQYVGVFNLSLGSDPAPIAGVYTSLSSLIQGESDVYVEVGFDPAGASTYTEVFSRMPLEASGYAIRAKYADSATGATEMSWSGLKSPTGNLSLQHSTYTTLFNWATGTGTNNLFSLTSDASANGIGALMNVQTGVGSSLIPLRVRAGATEAIYVNSSGNVGIGTTEPSGKLTVAKDNTNYDLSSLSTAHFVIDNTNASGQNKLIFAINGVAKGGIRGDYPGNFNWHATGSQGHQFYTSLDVSAPEMSIGANGVLIGGAAGEISVNALDVKGNAAIGSTYARTAAPSNGMIIEGNIGIGTTSPTSLLSVGSTSQFQVNSSGDIVKLKNLTYSWPSSHTIDGFLKDDGSGNLTWTTITEAGGVTGTGVAGQATFWTGTSTVSGDNAFWWDNTNKRLGIGTTAPSALLSLKGNLSSALTGTVAVTNLSTTVVGTGTSFTTELAVGDSIKIGSEVFTVSVITDNLNLTLDSAYQGVTASGLIAYRDPTLFAVDNGDAVNKLTITRSGNVGIGTTFPSTQLHTTGGVRLAGITTGTETTAVMSDVNGNLSKRVLGSLAFNNSLAFLDLSDVTETTYTGSGGQLVAVNTTETGLEFVTSVPASSVPLSGITGAVGANSISNGDNAQAWNWQLTTADKVGFTFGESAASTALGSPYILSASTLATSTATPLYVKNLGNAASFRVDDEATDTTPFIIGANGNVGIGTTTLTNKLEVAGNINLSTGSSYNINGNSVLNATSLGSTVTGSSLTSVGTLISGTWNATAIGPTFGGTGQTTYTTGDILYASAANTLAKRAIGTTGQVLTVSGGVPVWSDPAGGGGVAFSGITSGTNTTAAMVVGTGASLVYNGGTAYSGGINSNYLLGGTWAAPGAIGSTTANTGAFTTLNASTSLTTSLIVGNTSLAMRPSTDALTAIQLQNAAGTGVIVNVDTTNSRTGIGTTTPSTQLHTTGGVRLAGITTGTETTAVMSDVNGNLSKRVLGSLAFNNSLAFLDLSDVTETTYTGSGGQLVAVNTTETGLEFVTSVPASSVPLSGITAAVGANSISNGDNAQAWNWQLTTSDKVGFTFGESVASTALGSPYILSASTLATSTATPLYVKNLGNAASFRVDDEATDTTPFIIGAGGNVGIGTTTLTNKLEVAGNINLNTGSSYNINGNSVLNATSLGSTVTGSSLTSVGTLISGTWNATAIGPTFGGTGQTTYTTGDILYASAANTLAKRAIGTTGQVLTVSGGVPVWSDVGAAGSVAFSGITSGTNTTAAMVVGTGASLVYNGGTAYSGGINSNYLLGGTWAVPGAIGSTTANTGAFTTLNASTSLTTPLIQGRATDPYELTLKSTVNAYNAIRVVNATNVEVMSFDTMNSRVGIGITAPSTQLHTTGGVRLAGITTSTESTAVMADVDGNLSTRGLGLLAFEDSVPGDNWGTQVVQTNTTLTGDGTFTTPLGINLANANTWTASQTFSASTYFPGSGIWNSTGNVGIGTQTPGSSKLYVSGSSTSLVNLGDTLYVDSTNKRVSIGGGTPAVRFHIQETIGGINKAYITNVGTTDAENQLWFGTGYGGANEKWSGIGQAYNDGSLRFTAGGSLSTPQMTLLPNGNFGIGVVNPSSKLTLYGSSTATTIGGFEVGMRIANTNTTTNNWQSIVFGDTAKAGIEVKNVDHTNDYGDIAFTTRASDGWLPRMYIQSGGYVGVGNSAPVSLFSVGSSSQFQVDTLGDITKIKNLSYTWPTAHTANGFLKNNGTGGLSWAEVNAVQSTGTPYGSATEGPLAFWTGTSTIGAPTPYGLYWDDVNQYLGIGTNNPSAPLDIAGGTGGSLIKNSSGDITIEPAANLIISQGNVGIGVTVPLAKLHVKGNQILLKNEADADLGLVLDSGSTTTYRDVIYFKDRGTDIFGLEKTSTNAFQLYDYAGTGVSRILVEGGINSGISFRTKGTGDFSFITDTTTRVIIDETGRVGIGTTTLSGASGDLTVYGGDIFLGSSLTQLSADASYFYLNAPDGTTRFQLGASAVDKRIIFTLHDASGVAKLQVRDSGTAEVAYINSDGGAYFAGNVGFGTTSLQERLTLSSGSNIATVMATPGAPTVTCNTTGGTLADGTYYYKIVASDGVGTTVAGTQGSCTITGGAGAGSVSLSWSAITGASSYRIYGRDTNFGQYWTSSTASYTDTGTTGTTGTSPTTTTAYVNKLTASGNSWISGGNLGVGTATPEQKLDVNGFVKSEASAFLATLSAVVTSPAYAIFDLVKFNIGSDYSSTTGKYTAPVDGLYELCWGGVDYPQDAVARVYLHVNGVNYYGDATHLKLAGGTDATDAGGRCVTVYMSASDYAQVYVGVGGLNYNMSYFSGHLIVAQ